MIAFWSAIILLAILSGHIDAAYAEPGRKAPRWYEDHWKRWALRAAIAGLAAAVALRWRDGAWMDSAMTALAAAPAFSLLFRSTMSWVRGFHQLYVSPSNAYDQRALRVMRPAWLPKELVTVIFKYHQDLYWAKGEYVDLLVPGRPVRITKRTYRRWVHSAGLCLVLAESIAALLLLSA